MVAYYTHQAALAVRRSLAERGLTQRELAQRLAVKDETLGRKLRGEAWASLRDVLTWARELGIDMLPAPESREELAARVFECLGSSTARGTSHACSGPSISIGEGKMERGRLSPSVELPR